MKLFPDRPRALDLKRESSVEPGVPGRSNVQYDATMTVGHEPNVLFPGDAKQGFDVANAPSVDACTAKGVSLP